MNQHGPPAACQFEQGSGIGPTRRPAKYEIDGFCLLKQRHGDLTGSETFPSMAYQQIDDRSPAERSRHLLTEGGQPPDQIQVQRGGGF